MPKNVGVLTAHRTAESDEMFTPYYAVEPIMKYIPKNKTVWCPFDKEWSAFYRSFSDRGYNVIRSHIDDGLDFFQYEPDDYDVIVSNPPFSKKDSVLKRLYELDKPFAILLPLNSMQGQKRCELFIKHGIQVLTFDKRISYHNENCMNHFVKGSPFASAYFCKDILPKELIVASLNEYDKPLRNSRR